MSPGAGLARCRPTSRLATRSVALFSAEHGFCKPHPSIFAEALRLLGLPARDVWFAGDKPQRDVCGARRMGMTSVLMDGPHLERVGDRADHVPDIRVADLAGLALLLARQARVKKRA